MVLSRSRNRAGAMSLELARATSLKEKLLRMSKLGLLELVHAVDGIGSGTGPIMKIENAKSGIATEIVFCCTT